MKRFRVSVRTLVEHTLRSGDLSFESTLSLQAVDGLRAQRKVQESRPEEYRREVTVSRIVQTKQAELEVQGRIDGLNHTSEGVWIEEIKATREDPETLRVGQDPLHWGQLQVYAYLYALEHSLESLEIQLSYFHWDSGEILAFRRSCQVGELSELFNRLVSSYMGWVLELDTWYRERDRSIESLGFPFKEYRQGQRKLAVEIFRAIAGQKQLLVEAPTGIGKTLAALLPAVKSLRSDHLDKVFYLTARTTGKQTPEDSICHLLNSGLRIKSLTLTAREKICFNPSKECRAEDCEYARGFYDKLGAALLELFQHDLLDRTTVEEIARRHTVCPFELSVELSRWVDCLIADYNYVFDPRVLLRRLLLEEKGSYVFLVDEAHNLVDRARDMYSAELRKEEILAVRRLVKGTSKALHGCLGRLNRWFLRELRLCRESGGQRFLHTAPSGFSKPARLFLAEAAEWLADPLQGNSASREAVHGLFLEIHRFVRILERFDAGYLLCYLSEKTDLRVKLFCMDPAPQLAEALGRARSTVFLSGTLTPVEYFKKTLGCRSDCDHLLLDSPFPSQNLRVLIQDQISTTYRQRSATREDVSQVLHDFVRGRPGNYLLFFPSYEYLSMVHQVFSTLEPHFCTLVQTTEMSEPERLQFLQHFTDAGGVTLVGFAVLGGVFGEGIDLVGERLCGAAVVGVGLPGITPEREQIRHYYEEEWGSGFDYAYRFPGFQRVLQAAGRVIRSERDRGVVFLIDQRYTFWNYRRLLPHNWNPVRIRGQRELGAALESFWGRSTREETW